MDDAPNPHFTFINISHPNELKDPETIDHVRCSAMSNFGRLRRNRRAKNRKHELVFELDLAMEMQETIMPEPNSAVDAADPIDALDIKRDLEIVQSVIDSPSFVATSNEQSLELLESWQSAYPYDEYSGPTTPMPIPESWRNRTEELQATFSECSNPIVRAWKEELSHGQSWIHTYEALIHLVTDTATPIDSWIAPTVHHLLSLRPLASGTTRAGIIEEICRIGTLLFLAPIWRTASMLSIRTANLRHNLLAILQNYFADWGSLRPLLLWTLANAARESESEIERQHFVIRTTMVLGKMELNGWDQLRGILERVMWWNGTAEAAWDIVKRDLALAMQPIW